jgi:ubiquinone/menaquinone biosynthesis C-methylase UbiE
MLKISSLPEMYEEWLVGPLFRPWAEIVLKEVAPAPGDRVLDVACGTGIVARLAKERLGGGAQIVGVDASPNMLAVARRVAPEIEWREGNASALPLHEDEKFDVIVCHQGLQFFADKPTAVRQMSDVLTPAGRLAVAVWRSDDECPFIAALRSVAERHLGPIADLRHSFGDASALTALMREAGLHDVRIQRVSRVIRFPDETMFVRLNSMALVGMSRSGKAMNEDERAQMVETLVNESAAVLRAHREGSELVFGISANLAFARA